MLASFHNGEGWGGSGAWVHLVGLGASVCRDGPGTWVCMCQPVPWIYMGQPRDLGVILAPGSIGTNLVLGPVFGFAGASLEAGLALRPGYNLGLGADLGGLVCEGWYDAGVSQKSGSCVVGLKLGSAGTLDLQVPA